MLKKMNYNFKDILLLINKKIDLSITDDDGKNLFFYINDIKSVVLLIKNNVDINKVDFYGNSALFSCTYPSVMKELLKYLNPNHINKENRTALFYVNAECSKVLLENSADVSIKDKYGNTAFLYNSSCYHIEDGLFVFKDGGKREKFKLLLDYTNDVNEKNDNQESILCLQNYTTEEQINLLFNKGLDFNIKERYGNRNVLEKNSYLIKFLSKEMVETIDFDKVWLDNPLLFSVINEFKRTSIIKTIKKINVLNNKNETILFHIKEYSLLKKVVDNCNVDIHQINLNGENVLFSQDMNAKKIRFLYEKGVNCNQQNIRGQTALDYFLSLYNEKVKEKDVKSKYKKKYFEYIENVKELLSIKLAIPLQFLEEDIVLKNIINLRKPVVFNKESLERIELLFILKNSKPKLRKRL